MKNFFTKNGILLLTSITVLAVVLCIISAASSGTGFVHNALGVIASPFRAAGSAVSGWVGGISDHFSSLDELQEENDRLRREVAELERQLRQAKEDSEENARLRTLLDLRQQRQDFAFETALVVGQNSSNWASSLTLNKGTSCGVAIGDCVVNEEGFLVGVITDAGLTWSTVTTIVDTSSQLGALVFRTGEVTVAQGDLALIVPAHSPIDGAIMLVEYNNHRFLRKVKKLADFTVILQSFDKEYDAVTAQINECTFIGRAAKLEVTL